MGLGLDDTIKTDILELESLREEVLTGTIDNPSPVHRVSIYFPYFEKILSCNNPLLSVSFLAEFLEEYLNSVSKFDVYGNDPGVSLAIIKQLRTVAASQINPALEPQFVAEADRLEKQYNHLTEVLEGNRTANGAEHKAYFPLLEKTAVTGYHGVIESVTVRISKAENSDKFIIIPSEKETEKRILEQCRLSWSAAVEQMKKYVRSPFEYHEVIINFDRKMGFYEGSSLGISLALSFFEQLLQFYNPPYVIKIKEHCIFTGGLDSRCGVTSVGGENAMLKTRAVFFSGADTFVFPAADESAVKTAAGELKAMYEKRKVKLIPAEDFSDVLNRRDLVEVKKRNILARGGKYIRKNWMAAAASLVLTALLSFLFVFDFDDNPALVTSDGTMLHFKNKNGKILKSVYFPVAADAFIDPDVIGNIVRIMDVDNDHENEIIMLRLPLPNESEYSNENTLVCYNKKFEVLWEYTFKDSITAERETISINYTLRLVDTLWLNNSCVIFCLADNRESFPGAVFAIWVKDGKRFEKTLWCSGHLDGVVLHDISGDGVRDIIGISPDNGLNSATFWALEVKEMDGYRPTRDDYILKYKDKSKFLFYFQFPKSDVDTLLNRRWMSIVGYAFDIDTLSKSVNVNTAFYTDNVGTAETMRGMLGLKYYYLKNEFEIYVKNEFSLFRDSLVNAGILNSPLTDTKEYRERFKKGILAYRDGGWIRKDE
ncbi:MAG: hypothetical protein AMXMBFR48_21270 [Ignavibacteriales bacterium]